MLTLAISCFSQSGQSLIHVWLFVTPWAWESSLPITNPQSLLKLTSIESVMPSNHLILCRPFLLLSSIFPSIRVFSNESVLHIRWPKIWSFSFSSKVLEFLLLFDHFQFTLIHGPDIPGSYAILFFLAMDFTSITSHIHCQMFSLWFHLFILSACISLLLSNSILGTYRPGESIFQCPIFLAFPRCSWAMPCRASQDGLVMVGVLTKRGPLEKGMANHFSILALRTPRTPTWVYNPQNKPH